jgi:acetyl esterase/lipase
MKYIENLKKAGVDAKADVYEGCYHAFDLFGRKKQIGKTATAKWIKEFKYAVEKYYAKQEFSPYQSS